MEFYNNTTLEDVTDKDVDVFLNTDGSMISSLPLCRTFLKDGQLWVDCIPHLEKKYTAPVPDNAMISRNDKALDAGRYGVFVNPATELGRLARHLMDAKAKLDREQGRSNP
jgi:hypothetical protein